MSQGMGKRHAMGALRLVWCGVLLWSLMSGTAAQGGNGTDSNLVEERYLTIRTVQVVPTKCPYHGTQNIRTAFLPLPRVQVAHLAPKPATNPPRHMSLCFPWAPEQQGVTV